MTDALDAISGAVVDVLIIVAVLAVPLVLVRTWLASRRRQLVVGELVDCTGIEELGRATLGLTRLARQRIDADIRLVAARREGLSAALTGAERVEDRAGPAPARVRDRIDTSLNELLSAARDVAPAQAQPAVQLLGMLAARPRGLQVTGVLQRRGGAAPRLGLSLDVLDIARKDSVASQTFWEPEAAAAGDASAAERVIRLLAPAGRWAAIQLVIQSLFEGGASDAERGLDRLLTGVLLAQSAQGFLAAPDPLSHDAGRTFQRLAAEELRQAADALGDAPLPRAALADTLDRLAATAPDLYVTAHREYARAVAGLATALPARAPRWRVREATSWLASGLPGPRADALRALAAPGLEPGPGAGADELYDAACLYALGADADPSRGALRETAARLLRQALAADPSPDRQLLRHAEADPQLNAVRDELAGIERELAATG